MVRPYVSSLHRMNIICSFCDAHFDHPSCRPVTFPLRTFAAVLKNAALSGSMRVSCPGISVAYGWHEVCICLASRRAAYELALLTRSESKTGASPSDDFRKRFLFEQGDGKVLVTTVVRFGVRDLRLRVLAGGNLPRTTMSRKEDYI
jgi:hypothetical protein